MLRSIEFLMLLKGKFSARRILVLYLEFVDISNFQGG